MGKIVFVAATGRADAELLAERVRVGDNGARTAYIRRMDRFDMWARPHDDKPKPADEPMTRDVAQLAAEERAPPRVGTDYEEWRLVTKLLDRTELLEEIVFQLRGATPEDVDVHSRDEDEVMTYTYSEEEMREAEAELESILADEAVPSESTLSRWNPGGECWQDPRLPVSPSHRRIEPGWIELGELGWEVRLKTQGSHDARKIEEQLREDGRPVYSDGGKRVTVGVSDEEEASRLVDQLRLAAPLAQIQKRRLTRFRRWLIRQALLGNYASNGEVGP